jgi:pyruvate dehydrogenase E2 component (dihydrolipoamide acetyltransferase)
LLIIACARALVAVPDINVELAEKELHRFKAADIAVVTAVQGGLATPAQRRF